MLRRSLDLVWIRISTFHNLLQELKGTFKHTSSWSNLKLDKQDCPHELLEPKSNQVIASKTWWVWLTNCNLHITSCPNVGSQSKGGVQMWARHRVRICHNNPWLHAVQSCKKRPHELLEPKSDRVITSKTWWIWLTKLFLIFAGMQQPEFLRVVACAARFYEFRRITVLPIRKWTTNVDQNWTKGMG